MASYSEIALVNTSEQTETPKPRKTRTRRSKTPKAANDASAGKSVKRKQPADTDIVPVMKLRAIDIVDDETPVTAKKGTSNPTTEEAPQVIHIPPVKSAEGTEKDAAGSAANGLPDAASAANGDLVTDPELLELLEQLSATIDTAHTVLDAAAGAENTIALDPKPEPLPEPKPETEMDEPPPLAAGMASEQTPEIGRSKTPKGFGLVANSILTGLVFAAGVGWLLHTNPWLLENTNGEPIDATPQAVTQDSKDQASLQIRDEAKKQVAAAPSSPSATLSSLAPPNADPVPKEAVKPAVPALTPASSEPMRGTAGQPIGLNVTLPVNASGSEMSIMVQGVPDRAKLSAGKSLGSGNWLLNEGDLDGLTLQTEQTFRPGDYELEVILVRSDGSIPETRKVQVSVLAEPSGPETLAPAAIRQGEKKSPGEVKPATAEQGTGSTPVAAAKDTSLAKAGVAIQVETPKTEPAPAPAPPVESLLTPQEIQTLLARGDTLLREGDVAGARLLLEYAAQRGNKEAMVKLAKSYDPEHLTQLGVRGVKADIAVATRWYDRAAKTGTSQ